MAAKRPLAEILEEAGKATDKSFLGKSEKRDRLLAELVWTMATRGAVVFPDGREIKASARDWKDVTAWIFSHIDGPVRKEIDLQVGAGDGLEGKTDEELQAIITSALAAESATDPLPGIPQPGATPDPLGT